jgi:hypothetical protein
VIRPEPILGSKLCSENRLLISDQLSMSASAISRQSKNAPGYWGVSQYQSRVRHEVGLNERIGCTQRFADYSWENDMTRHTFRLVPTQSRDCQACSEYLS